MHLLYLQQLLVVPGAGGNDRCWQFARMWHAAGHKVTFLCSDAHIPRASLEAPPPVGTPMIVEGISLYFLSVAYRHQMPFPKRALSFVQFYYRVLVQKTLLSQMLSLPILHRYPWENWAVSWPRITAFLFS